MLSRRALIRASFVTATATGAAAALATRPAPALASLGDAERPAPVSTFVSAPDFFNGDVADLSGLPTWDGGLNSINPDWERAIDKCLAAVASHAPDAVFVAGDLVEGRWNVDSDDRRLFGEVSMEPDPVSVEACEAAITAASSVYYGYYTKLFRDRGLTLYPALGDHEILDDRWEPSPDDRWSSRGYFTRGKRAGDPDNRWHLVPHCKRVWADHFTRTPDGTPRFPDRPVGAATEHTAYATEPGPNLTLVTVDVFTRHAGGVRIGVHGAQLRWLRRTIRAAKRAGRVVVVQGHVPVDRPYRSLASGGLRVVQGVRSPFYRAMDECGADFYLCGETHDTTVQQARRRAPVQISHGCIFRYGFNYLVGRVYADGSTRLDYYEIPMLSASSDKDMWSSDHAKRQRTRIEYGDPVHRGRLVVNARRRIVRRSKKLGVYVPETDTWALSDNVTTVMT